MSAGKRSFRPSITDRIQSIKTGTKVAQVNAPAFFQSKLSEVAIMTDWTLLASVEGLEQTAPSARFGALWETLQGEKEQVCRELLAAGSLLHADAAAVNERDFADESTDAVEWRHRDQLECRLRDIIDAQDRIFDGRYGRCSDCGNPIEARRLAADPAATLCVACKNSSEPEVTFHTM
jgi:RNA polymerase-binding transcription factor DksA